MFLLHNGFIRDLDFYSGGFPAQYAPRLSSIVDIHFREGSKEFRKFQIDNSIAGVGIFSEGMERKNAMAWNDIPIKNVKINFIIS